MTDMNPNRWYDCAAAPHPLLAVISGPSGVGKDAVLDRMRELGYPFHFVVTATTRAPRPDELHGEDYFFVPVDEFQRMIDEDELIEHAMVYGQHKGVPKAQVRQALVSGHDVLMRVDVQGAATVRRRVPESITVFLIAASEDELIKRLTARGTDSPRMLERRISILRDEMERIDEFDYVVVNREGQLDEAVRQIVTIMQAEKCRTDWRPVRL